MQFFKDNSSQKYRNKIDYDKEYTLEDIKNIDDFPEILEHYYKHRTLEDGLQLLKVILLSCKAYWFPKLYKIYNFWYIWNKFLKSNKVITFKK